MNQYPRLKITFLFVFFIVSLMFFSPHYFPALALAVCLHELGHILAAQICGIRFHELRLGLLGASLLPRGELFSYKKEIVLCLCGPLASILSAGVAVHILDMDCNSLFVMSSVALGLLNLMPIKDFDGGRALKSFLCLFLSESTASTILKATSFLLLFSLWSLSLYLLLRVGASLALFVFCLCVFGKIFICVSR